MPENEAGLEVTAGSNTMTPPMVSVVMSVFNGERFLREAVESILNQSFREFEFVIIDDGSTDGTDSILDSYERTAPGVRVYNQENRGLIESLNRACGLARGKYIARMDADDIALKDRLMQQIEFMEEHAGVGVLGGAVEQVDATGRRVRTVHFPLDHADIISTLVCSSPFSHPAVVIRKEVFVSVGGYRSAFADAEDYDLWLRMAERCELANLEAAVLKYRIHPNRVSHRHMQQQIISTLAARASASSRRKGLPDPLNSVKEITPAVLAGLGITQDAVENALLMGYQNKVIGSLWPNFDEQVLPNVDEMLALLARSHQVQDSIAARVWFAAARAYMSQHKLVNAVGAATKAFLIHPVLAEHWAWRELRRLMENVKEIVGYSSERKRGRGSSEQSPI